MRLYAEGDTSHGQAALEDLELRLKTDVLLEGKELAGQFKLKQWPALVFATTSQTLVALKLTGVTLDQRNPLAVINRRTFGKAESAGVPLPTAR